MHWPKRATGKRSCSIVHSAAQPTLPRVWRATLLLPVEKGTMHKRRASVRQQRLYASRHRQNCYQLSVRHSSRLLQPQERLLTSLPLYGNGIEEQHARRTKQLTMLCQTERLELILATNATIHINTDTVSIAFADEAVRDRVFADLQTLPGDDFETTP